MKYTISLFSIIAILIAGCTGLTVEDSSVTYKNYGYETQDNSVFVNVDYTGFKTFKSFVNHIETSVCEGQIPKIRVKNKEYVTDVSISNPCFSKYGCILLKNKNIITLHNDLVERRGRFYSLDSLEFIIKRDVENYGRNPLYADHPNKVFFKITYDTANFEKFPETLKTLVDTYEKITQRADIKIWLATPIPVPPPPPPLPSTPSY